MNKKTADFQAEFFENGKVFTLNIKSANGKPLQAKAIMEALEAISDDLFQQEIAIGQRKKHLV